MCEQDRRENHEAEDQAASSSRARATLLAVGYQVGQQLGEVYSRDRPRFVERLDCIKFVCKDLWFKLFKKPVDNLKTNHRGVFVLLDSSFRWTSRIDQTRPPSSSSAESATSPSIPPAMFAALACGILQGSLHALGVHCVVSADLQKLPACTFTLRISE